ncbi:MAG: hypothetical protein A2W26_10430 [Acidobacteria bacterium RBG_16_64_8]|nr:MAG: hypothetical protein A2W26_10430 [Acidobacteria bacterium RBG_16_64_8]
MPSPPTSLPAHVYSFGSRPWPESGDLLVDDGDNPVFALDVRDLAPGDYLVLVDARTRVASLYSLETGSSQTLLVPDLAEDPPEQFAESSAAFLLGSREPYPSWRLYDLRARASWGIGETCRGAFTSDLLSPNGEWIGTVCHEDYQMDGVAFEHVLVQFLSTRTGTGVQYVVPSVGTTRDQPSLAWIDEGRALLSRVHLNGEFRACAISPEEGTLYCPALGLGARFAVPGEASPGKPWVPFAGRDRTPTPMLVPMGCFEVGTTCGRVVEIPWEQPVAIMPSADPSIIWWSELRGPDATAEMGLVDLNALELRQLVSLGGDYSAYAMCPDGSCLFLYNHDSETHWRLNLDGSLANVPIGGAAIIGAFSIP